MNEKSKKLVKAVDKMAGNILNELSDLKTLINKTCDLENAQKLKIIFNENTGKIHFNNKECQIPFKTNQYYLCQKIFKDPKSRIDEINIMESDFWKANKDRSVYDAVRLVNSRINENLEIDNLIKWQKNTVWVNENYHEFIA